MDHPVARVLHYHQDGGIGPIRHSSAERTGSERPLFEVWGCRGSRNIVPPRSAIGSNTSAYSLLDGADLYVFDAGRGIDALSAEVSAAPRFEQVERVHILISHSHMDHWEGLKDAEWMWRGSPRLSITVHAPAEAMTTIQRGYDHPAYVALELLAAVAGQNISFTTVGAAQTFPLGDGTVETYSLNHFSGYRHDKSVVETVGYLVKTRNGATVAYFSDHMPEDETVATEERILSTARLAVFDAHYPTIAEQNFGHGSQEYAATVARRHPSALILAGHHGATLSDDAIRSAYQRLVGGAPNFRLAIEGEAYAWFGEETGWQNANSEARSAVRLAR